MATVDHRKLDAYHRARMEIAIKLEAYKRRIYDDAKTAIDTEIQKQLAAGKDYDGSEIGRACTLTVLNGYVGEPQAAIEGAAEES